MRSDFPSTEQITLVFSENGKLDYWACNNDQLFSAHMFFRIEDDKIVTWQTEKSEMERRKFWFEVEDVLVLEKEGQRFWFQRETNSDS